MTDKYAIDLNESQLIMDDSNEVVAYLPRFLVFLKMKQKLRIKLLDGTNEVETIVRRYGNIPIHQIKTGAQR